MASPFSIFRKNQKLMIAVLGVLCMFAFVFLPIVMESMGSRSVVNPVVVTTKFGDLRESDIHSLVTQRRKITAILTDVLQMAGAPPTIAHQWVESRIGPPTEDAVVTSWVLARHAEQQGVVISDTTINNFLKQLTEDRVKSTNFLTAFKRSGISELQFFNAMRDELATLQLDSIFQTSLRGITPAERWGYFNRVKQQATIEAVPVPVEDYLGKDEPTDVELKAFFEENKEKLPFPNSPEPGFREPQKVALEWFKANYDKFTSPEMVTDEEIKERYEKNKELYDLPAKKPEAEAEAKDATDVKEPAGPTETKAPEAKQESEKDKKSTDTSAAGERSPFRLASFLEEEKPAENPPPATDKPATDAAPEAKPAENAAVAQEKPADKPEAPVVQEKPAENPPPATDKPATDAAAPEAKPAENPAAAASQEKPADKPEAPVAQEKPADKPETPVAQEKPEEPKAGLSEATKTRIRREIAYEKIQKVFGGLSEQLDQYRRQLSKYEVAVIQQRDKKGDKTPPTPPAKPNFEKLAQENGLTVDSTGLIAQWEAQSRDVGASLVGGRSPVWLYAFTAMTKFKPEMSGDLKGDLYLFWKTDEAKERIPKFEDDGVRDRVLRQWKMVRARKLALEKAESLAAEAAKSGKSLRQTFEKDPNLQVIAPPPFSWLTFGNVALGSAPGAVRISTVPGVGSDAEDFMRTVFHLRPDDVGSAFNAPQTVAYVVRLIEFTPSHDVLWKQFEVDDFSKYVPAAQSDRQKLMRAWLEEIKTSAGVKWNRKADQMGDSGPRGEE
jgi:hypothetical protein